MSRDSNYELTEWNGDIPAPARQTRAEKDKPLQVNLDAVEADESRHGRWFIVAHYGKGATATSVKADLTRTYGNAAVCKGWDFATRQVDQDDGSQRVAIFGKYTPSEIVAGAYEEYLDERAKKAAARGK